MRTVDAICNIVIILSVAGLCYVFFKIGQLHPVNVNEDAVEANVR